MKSVSDTLIKLREMGYRMTPQRQAVLQILCGNRLHPSAEEIHREAKGQFPMLSLATVYNTLRVLEEIDEVRSINTGKSSTRFDYRTEPHGHFYCQNCGNVIDIEADTAPEVNGHLVRHYEFSYHGLCAACRSSL
jgi:Fur family peroxide stress response transcriptional regulator